MMVSTTTMNAVSISDSTGILSFLITVQPSVRIATISIVRLETNQACASPPSAALGSFARQKTPPQQ